MRPTRLRLPGGIFGAGVIGLATLLCIGLSRVSLPPAAANNARRSALEVTEVVGFRPSACGGNIPAGPALNGSTWIAPQQKQAVRFQSEGCCRDRYALLDALRRQGFTGWAAELGVASGGYSREILRRTDLAMVFSIDMWASDRGHNDKQRGVAQGKVAEFGSRSCVLWSRFDEVQGAFPEALFDFVYVDGYAHTGEEGGRSIREWYSKVRSGGVFGGHDYGKRYPLVKEAVDAFVSELGLELHVIGPADKKEEPAADNDCCPSWFVVKP